MTREPDPAFLEQVYPLPRAFYSETEDRRAGHQDIMGLSDFELWREIRRVEHRLALEGDRQPWLVARLAALQVDRARRQAERPRQPGVVA